MLFSNLKFWSSSPLLVGVFINDGMATPSCQQYSPSHYFLPTPKPEKLTLFSQCGFSLEKPFLNLIVLQLLQLVPISIWCLKAKPPSIPSITLLAFPRSSGFNATSMLVPFRSLAQTLPEIKHFLQQNLFY